MKNRNIHKVEEKEHYNPEYSREEIDILWKKSEEGNFDDWENVEDRLNKLI